MDRSALLTSLAFVLGSMASFAVSCVSDCPGEIAECAVAVFACGTFEAVATYKVKGVSYSRGSCGGTFACSVMLE